MARSPRTEDPNARALPKAAKTVTVCCKYPSGILLRVFQNIDVPVPVPGGGIRSEKQAQQVGPAVKINGPGAPVNRSSPHEIAGGYAMTFGVDADFFERWLDQNRDSDLVKNRLIFVAPSREDARAISEEHADVQTNIGGLVMPQPGEKVTDNRVRRSVDKIGQFDPKNKGVAA